MNGSTERIPLCRDEPNDSAGLRPDQSSRLAWPFAGGTFGVFIGALLTVGCVLLYDLPMPPGGDFGNIRSVAEDMLFGGAIGALAGAILGAILGVFLGRRYGGPARR